MANPYPHYAWAGGHFLLLAASLRYLLAWITFKSVLFTFWYRLAFAGAIISYAIVVYKSLGTPQLNTAYARKALADENFQYFLLSLFWVYTQPISLALVPYATFSLFHVLTFTRTNIIPRIFPANPAPGQADRTAQHPFAKSLHAWVKANYDPAMRYVAWTELAIFVRLALGAIFGLLPFISSKLPFKNSLLAPMLFAHFLRLRYYHSGFTRQVVHTSDAAASKYVDSPGAHPLVKKAWDPLRLVIIKWSGSLVLPQAAAPAPGGAAAGAAPRR